MVPMDAESGFSAVRDWGGLIVAQPVSADEDDESHNQRERHCAQKNGADVVRAERSGRRCCEAGGARLARPAKCNQDKRCDREVSDQLHVIA
jgi:hypothetical protein